MSYFAFWHEFFVFVTPLRTGYTWIKATGTHPIHPAHQARHAPIERSQR
jgi:hypothetical protein